MVKTKIKNDQEVCLMNDKIRTDREADRYLSLRSRKSRLSCYIWAIKFIAMYLSQCAKQTVCYLHKTRKNGPATLTLDMKYWTNSLFEERRSVLSLIIF